MFLKKVPHESKFLMLVISGASLFGLNVAYSKLRYDPDVYVSKYRRRDSNNRSDSEIEKFLIQ